MGWLDKRRSNSCFSDNLVGCFLLSQFKKGYCTSTINAMRSSINFFTLSILDLENSNLIKRLFKFFYKQRPLQPRYSSFWSVEQLLNFLKTWYPLEDLSLKQLTLKTIALIALSSSDRGQTIHKASILDMEVSNNKIIFIIRDKLKNTRKFLKPTIITCVNSSIPELDVASHVSHYIDRTKNLRGESSQLFISWVTKKPVTKQSLARWLKLVLSLAGIDTTVFKAHSYRGAGLTKAFQKGATLDQIIKAGNWKNSSVFSTYYNAPSYEMNIENIILES